MKKIFYMIFISLTAISLVACSGDQIDDFEILMMINPMALNQTFQQKDIVRNPEELYEVASDINFWWFDSEQNTLIDYVLFDFLMKDLGRDFFDYHALFVMVFTTPTAGGGYFHIQNIKTTRNTLVFDYDLMLGALDTPGTMIVVVSLNQNDVTDVSSFKFNQVEVLYNFNPEFIILSTGVSEGWIINALGDIEVLKVEYLNFANIVYVHLADPTRANAIEAVNRLSDVTGIRWASLNHNGWQRSCVDRHLGLSCTC